MKKIYIILCFVLVGFQTCTEKTLIRHYYILELPMAFNNNGKADTSSVGICEILRTKVPPVYDQPRIAVRRRSHEISYYQYHYWAMNPGENLTTLLEKQIQKSHIFAYSSSEYPKKIPDYQIASDVYKLEALDNDDIFYARLEMRIDLIDYYRGKTVVTHKFDRTKAIESRDLNLFASELSILFQEEVLIFTSKIRSYLENNRPQAPADDNN